MDRRCVREADDSGAIRTYGAGMTSITRLSLRHRRLVGLAWLALTVVGALTVSSATSRLSHDVATPGTTGYDANQYIYKRLGIDGNEQPTIAVLTLPAGETMTSAAGQAAAARTFRAASQAGHVAVADYANTGNAKLIARDGRTTWALIDMPNPDVGPGVGVIDRLEPALRAAAPPGASVAVTGFEQIQSTGGGGGGGPSVLIMTLIGAAAALAVLVFVYGSAIAIVPLLIAAPSILTTFLLVLGLTQLITVNFLAEYLVAVMGLGVAIDYSLLLITRWREEREAGRANEDAILAAGPTAGRAVVLSGTIVAVGLLSLVLLPVPFLRSIGLSGMLIPLVAIIAATTLLPVILATLGPGLDKRRVRRGSTTYSRTLGIVGQARRPTPLDRRRDGPRDRARARHPRAVDEHRATARELARRNRPTSPDAPRARAPRGTQRSHLPDPDPDPRRTSRGRASRRDRPCDVRRIHGARTCNTRVPPRPRRPAERDCNRRGKHHRGHRHGHPVAHRARRRSGPHGGGR